MCFRIHIQWGCLIPNTNLAEEEQKDEDISFNGQMSFEEIVEGFAKMGEELNKQQF